MTAGVVAEEMGQTVVPICESRKRKPRPRQRVRRLRSVKVLIRLILLLVVDSTTPPPAAKNLRRRHALAECSRVLGRQERGLDQGQISLNRLAQMLAQGPDRRPPGAGQSPPIRKTHRSNWASKRPYPLSAPETKPCVKPSRTYRRKGSNSPSSAKSPGKKLKRVVAPALLWRRNTLAKLTEQPSDLYHQRNSAGHDWWISVDRL